MNSIALKMATQPMTDTTLHTIQHKKEQSLTAL